MEITRASVIRKSDALVEANLGESLALMSIDSGKYFGMNHIAKHIWQELETGISFDNLVEKLMSKFDVDKDTCVQHCEQFLSELQSKNLITAS